MIKKLKTYTTLFHLLGWLLLCLIFFVLFPLLYPVALPIEHYLYHLVLLLACIGFYYVNTKLLLPHVRWQKNAWLYGITLLLMMVVLIVGMNQFEQVLDLNIKIHRALHPGQAYLSKRNGFFISAYLSVFTVFIFGIGIAEFLVKRWNLNERIKIQLEQGKAVAELATLKAQINPHFIFNTLNTIHGLSYMDVDHSRKALVDLSKMMRYMMNEDQLESVALVDEIRFIEHYIDLMRYRLPDHMELDVAISRMENSYTIAPMILLTLIENVFKHGISTEKAAKIAIHIQLNNDQLHLNLSNEIIHQARKTKGIGIENTKKRLALLYPNRFMYSTKIENNRYICQLTIQLTE